jgi:hypothetical protein
LELQKTIPDNLPNLVARDPTSDIEHALQMLTPYNSHKTLGHYKDPSGSQKDQTTQLKKLCQEAVDRGFRANGYPLA